MKNIIFLILIIFRFCFSISNNPQFSQTPVKIPMYYGLSGRCENPEFLDLDADGDLDIVYERDYSGPNYPVYFRNDGNDEEPIFIRDENMFSWLDTTNFESIRFFDFDQDGDLDFSAIVSTYPQWPDINYVLLFENSGTIHSPIWQTNADTIYQANFILYDYNLVNVLDDTLPQVVICSDYFHGFGTKLFKQRNDSLIEVPNYFDNAWFSNSWLRVDFFKIHPDSTLMLIGIYRDGDVIYLSDFYTFGILKRTGSMLNPDWEPIKNEIGTVRLIKAENQIVPFAYYFQPMTFDYYSVCGLVSKTINLNSSGDVFDSFSFWMKGKYTRFTDISSFDWHQNGTEDICLLIYNNWNRVNGWDYGDIHLFQCLKEFKPDSLGNSVPFEKDFPLNYYIGGYGYPYFEFSDLDNDGDTDIYHLQSGDNYDNVTFEKILWNTNNDSNPDWSQTDVWNTETPLFYNSATLADLDNDGDHDLIISHSQFINPGFLGFHENIGSAQFPEFTNTAKLILNIKNSHPAFYDFDNDGDLDMIASYSTQWTPESGWDHFIKYFRNDSYDTSFVFTKLDSIIPLIPDISAIHLTDFDKDSDQDLFLLSESGDLYFVENLNIVNLEDIPEQPITKFHLSQNYPNPFNPETNITFTIPKTAKTKIEVFNLLGQKIKTLIDKELTVGSYTVIFNANNLPSGIYLFRLESAEYQKVRKMILLR